MQSESREPQVPESYDSFWEPVVVDTPTTAPTNSGTPRQSADADKEFDQVAEEILLGRAPERN